MLLIWKGRTQSLLCRDSWQERERQQRREKYLEDIYGKDRGAVKSNGKEWG